MSWLWRESNNPDTWGGNRLYPNGWREGRTNSCSLCHRDPRQSLANDRIACLSGVASETGNPTAALFVT